MLCIDWTVSRLLETRAKPRRPKPDQPSPLSGDASLLTTTLSIYMPSHSILLQATPCHTQVSRENQCLFFHNLAKQGPATPVSGTMLRIKVPGAWTMRTSVPASEAESIINGRMGGLRRWDELTGWPVHFVLHACITCCEAGGCHRRRRGERGGQCDLVVAGGTHRSPMHRMVKKENEDPEKEKRTQVNGDWSIAFGTSTLISLPHDS